MSLCTYKEVIVISLTLIVISLTSQPVFYSNIRFKCYYCLRRHSGITELIYLTAFLLHLTAWANGS